MAVGVYHRCPHSFRPFVISFAIKYHEINLNTYHEVASEQFRAKMKKNKSHNQKQIGVNFNLNKLFFASDAYQECRKAKGMKLNIRFDECKHVYAI